MSRTRTVVIAKKPVQNAFISKSGIYYDQMTDEVFEVTFVALAPCKTGQLVPNLIVSYEEGSYGGAMMKDGNYVYLGAL